MNQFHKDLERSQPAVVAVMKLLTQLYPEATVVETEVGEEQTLHGDIKLTLGDRVGYFEVKADNTAARTGNLAIEVVHIDKQTGRPWEGWLFKYPDDGCHFIVYVIPEGEGAKMLMFQKKDVRGKWDSLNPKPALVPCNLNPSYTSYNYCAPSGNLMWFTNEKVSEVYFPSGLGNEPVEFRASGLIKPTTK
jgi:hypothetical protein